MRWSRASSANSPAAKAGLKTGDVIVSIDGQVVDDQNAFDYRFGTRPLGGQAQVGVIRSGRETKRDRRAAERARTRPREEIVIKSRSPLSGVKVGNLSPALADELRLDPSAEGVVVLEVANGSVAQRLGFQRGDVVVSINDKRVADSKDLEQLTRDPSRLWEITHPARRPAGDRRNSRG